MEHKYICLVLKNVDPPICKGAPTMCDYSLYNVMTRPARVGDRLQTTAFSNSLTRGFATREQPNVAVCLLPGTEIAFEEEAECESWLPWMRGRKLSGRLARFRQINTQRPDTHHDALEFPNGEIVLLTRLCKDQKATVLQLPATARESDASSQEQLAPAYI
jgi:hypothetical protein